MDIVILIIQLLSGAAGGNIAGSLLKNYSLDTLWNSVVGILGGGIGGQILATVLGVGGGGAGLDIGTIIGNIASGGVGGSVLLLIIGLVRGALAR